MSVLGNGAPETSPGGRRMYGVSRARVRPRWSMTSRRGALFLGLLVLVPLGACHRSGSTRTGSPPDPLVTVSADELYRRGQALVARGDHLRAEQYFAAAIRRGYPEVEAVPRLVRACVASSRLSSALAYAEPYLERHPGDWSLRLLVATLYLGLSDFAQSRDALQQVVTDAPEQPLPWFLLGVVHRDELDDRDVARRSFERYLELAPEGEHAEEARAFVEGQGPADVRQPVRVPGHGPPVRIERRVTPVPRDASTHDAPPADAPASDSAASDSAASDSAASEPDGSEPDVSEQPGVSPEGATP